MKINILFQCYFIRGLRKLKSTSMCECRGEMYYIPTVSMPTGMKHSCYGNRYTRTQLLRQRVHELSCQYDWNSRSEICVVVSFRLRRMYFIDCRLGHVLVAMVTGTSGRWRMAKLRRSRPTVRRREPVIWRLACSRSLTNRSVILASWVACHLCHLWVSTSYVKRKSQAMHTIFESC